MPYREIYIQLRPVYWILNGSESSIVFLHPKKEKEKERCRQ